MSSVNGTGYGLTSAQDAANAKIAKMRNISSVADLKRLSGSSVSLFGGQQLSESAKQQAYLQYAQQLLNKYYDVDGRNGVSTNEFQGVEYQAMQEAAKLYEAADIANAKSHTFDYGGKKYLTYDSNYNGEVTEQEARQQLGYTDQANATRAKGNKNLSQLFAQNLDMNENGKIDAEELAFFTKMADGVDGKEDGVISSAGENAMLEAVTGMNLENDPAEYKKVADKAKSGQQLSEEEQKIFNRQKYINVINKFVQGETLTAEEQATLQEAQKTIRAGMRKASGINLEG